MKKLTVRTLISLGVVATMGLSVPALASAGTGRLGETPPRTYHQTLLSYRVARRAIETTFRTSVRQAHSAYVSALATATTSAQRSTAEQTYEAAIIQAAAQRSAALTALGPPPGKTT